MARASRGHRRAGRIIQFRGQVAKTYCPISNPAATSERLRYIPGRIERVDSVDGIPAACRRSTLDPLLGEWDMRSIPVEVVATLTIEQAVMLLNPVKLGKSGRRGSGYWYWWDEVRRPIFVENFYGFIDAKIVVHPLMCGWGAKLGPILPFGYLAWAVSNVYRKLYQNQDKECWEGGNPLHCLVFEGFRLRRSGEAEFDIGS